MIALTKRILTIFQPFWKILAAISGLIMVQKVGDLLVPVLAGRVIDAMAQHRTLESIHFLILSAFLFWVCHGSLLPYALGRFDLTRLRYAMPCRVGVDNLRRVLANAPEGGRDTALQQAVIERGEQVLVELVNGIVRIAIPMSLPGIMTLGVLLYWYPALGLIAVVGGALDVLVTIRLNRVLKPCYVRLQGLDYTRQRRHIRFFRELPAIVAQGVGQGRVAEYKTAFEDCAEFGTRTGLRFLGFSLGRGVIVNLTNLATWIVGVWYVDAGIYSLGSFLASLSWSSYVLNVLGAGIDLQKQWLETLPAIRAFFAEIDGPAAILPVTVALPAGNDDGQSDAIVIPLASRAGRGVVTGGGYLPAAFEVEDPVSP